MKEVKINGTDAAGEAGRRFVRVDAGRAGAADELARWLDEHPDHERALERVELAVALGKRLAADPGSALHGEAAAAASPRPSLWASRRVLAWSGTLAASVLVAVLVLVLPDGVPRASSPGNVTIEAARVVTFDAPSSSSAVLPTGAVVDAGAVAVLPFTSADATLAEGLERGILETLRTVPGLYVIGDATVSGYASTDLSPSEIGAQLGARGIVDAAIELVDGRVRVNARLRDAATGATLWRTDVDRPVDQLNALRYEIAENVAATMLDPSLREQAARADRAGAPVSVAKPVLQ